MPGSPHYLLEADLSVKWFVQEEDSATAAEVRDLFIQERIQVSTISLAKYELGNVFPETPSKTAETVQEILANGSGMAITTHARTNSAG